MAVRAVSLGVVLSALLAGAPTSTAVQASETQVKAAFLVSFLKFVEWSDERRPLPGEPFEVAVLRDEPFTTIVGAVAVEHRIGGRSVRVRLVQRPDDAVGAHLIFVPASERLQLPSILRELEGRDVLTVGDGAGFAQSGVMLNLVVAEQRMHFEANTAAAASAGVRLSAHLLRVARIVR